MISELAAMRIDYDQIKLKNLENSKNPMLQKRREKASSSQEGKAV